MENFVIQVSNECDLDQQTVNTAASPQGETTIFDSPYSPQPLQNFPLKLTPRSFNRYSLLKNKAKNYQTKLSQSCEDAYRYTLNLQAGMLARDPQRLKDYEEYLGSHLDEKNSDENTLQEFLRIVEAQKESERRKRAEKPFVQKPVEDHTKEAVLEFQRLDNQDRLFRFNPQEHHSQAYFDKVKRVRQRSENELQNFYNAFKQYEVIVIPNTNIKPVLPYGQFDLLQESLRNDSTTSLKSPSKGSKAGDLKMLKLSGPNFMMEVNTQTINKMRKILKDKIEPSEVMANQKYSSVNLKSWLDKQSLALYGGGKKTKDTDEQLHIDRQLAIINQEMDAAERIFREASKEAEQLIGIPDEELNLSQQKKKRELSLQIANSQRYKKQLRSRFFQLVRRQTAYKSRLLAEKIKLIEDNKAVFRSLPNEIDTYSHQQKVDAQKRQYLKAKVKPVFVKIQEKFDGDFHRFRSIKNKLQQLQKQFSREKYLDGNKYIHVSAVRLVKMLLRRYDISLRERIDSVEQKYINRELLSDTIKLQRGTTILLDNPQQTLKRQVSTLQTLESVYYTKGLEPDHPLQANHVRALKLKAKPWNPKFKNNFAQEVRKIEQQDIVRSSSVQEILSKKYLSKANQLEQRILNDNLQQAQMSEIVSMGIRDAQRQKNRAATMSLLNKYKKQVKK